ncbi:hypothetical protein BKA70DRAFT_1483738 [Coprinopsis sp. MPI-PUGE-AT-0042]|nr:hypothetical protein BKA70DRAFT_1483738 [Coprinopsis sp. MPI-PUGE-AT-0042]
MSSTLIDDVLDSILQHCERSTLAIVSRISYGIHALALPHLVRRVDLEDARQASLFLAFLLRYPPGTTLFPRGIAHHIFELRLDDFVLHSREDFHDIDLEGDPDYPCSQLAPMLTCALTDMTNLCLLEIGGNTEGAMKYSPELAKSLLGLPSLKSLTLIDVGVLASGALGKAAGALNRASQLQSLQLFPMLVSRRHAAQRSPCLDQLLSHLSPNVANLEISGFNVSKVISEVDGPAVVFPRSRRLQISRYGSSLHEISNAFPNISNLILEPGNLTPRPHFPDTLFPHLICLTANFDDVSSILRSPIRAGQRRKISRLDLFSESDALPDILSEIDGLKSLYFRQHPVQPGTWWQGLAKTISGLVVLSLSLTADSLQDIDLIGKQLPPLFLSVPLECIILYLCENNGITKEVDSAKVAGDMALSWAANVPTLKDVLFNIDFGLYGMRTMCTYGFEVLRGEGGKVGLQVVPEGAVDRIRYKYDRWN